jgi:hypothetical protein
VGGLLRHVYPASQSSWAQAMRYEIDQVADDGAALRFALGCLWGGCREAAAELTSATKGSAAMNPGPNKLMQPQRIGLACAFVATCLGIFYLVAAGAPAKYLVVNAVAFLLGFVALGGITRAMPQGGRLPSLVLPLLGACLLATALLGGSAEQAARWMWIGPLSVQMSLVILPLMIVAFARHPDALGTVGIAAGAVALALQPDRAMSGVLVFAMAVLAMTCPGRPQILALLVALAGFAATLARPDTLPAVPYVDQILFTAFEVHVLAGAAVLLGSLVLLLPVIVGTVGDPAGHAIHLVFGATWLGCVAASALGSYPTPVVGYGGSAILGYLLSLASLAGPTRVMADHAVGTTSDDDKQRPGLFKGAYA